MGTSKSYTGSGGKPGKKIREDVAEWLDQQQPPPDKPTNDTEEGEARPSLERPLLNVIGLIAPRRAGEGGDGPGGGSGGGGAQGSAGGRSGGGPRRSVARSAGTAGRAAAAAYAFATGNSAVLERLGLNLADLRALGDPILVTRRIVEVVCGPRGDSSIEDAEQRLIAADVADWVLSQQREGYEATPEDIAKHAIAEIMVDTLLTETDGLISDSESGPLAESELRQLADNLVDRVAVPIDGATEQDFSVAIEAGIESLRKIMRGDG
jgi:hypothetical protein